jgi:hypothetical protein
MTIRTPVSIRPIRDTAELVEHLKPMIERSLANDVSNTYYGDVGVYLPTQFLGPRKENRAIIILQPAFDDLLVGTRVASQEHRLLGVDVIGLVNITPYFKANPTEAFGESQLANVMRKLRTLLTQQSLSNLDGRVEYFSIEDIKWSWVQRDNLSLRGASLRATARIKVDRTLQFT